MDSPGARSALQFDVWLRNGHFYCFGFFFLFPTAKYVLTWRLSIHGAFHRRDASLQGVVKWGLDCCPVERCKNKKVFLIADLCNGE